MKNIVKVIVLILAAVILFAGCGIPNSNNKAAEKPTSDVKNEESEEIEEIETEPFEQPEERAEVGYTAPDFSVELLTGETVKLSDYRGKAVLLNFWATWCPPCVSEMPDIQKISEAFSGDLVVIAVNLSEQKNKVNGFISEKKYTFNVGLDVDASIQAKYPTEYIPYTIIIDANGVITKTHIGANSYSGFEEDIKAALGK